MSRGQFRCLADDALAQLTSLNLQAYWPGLNDSGLLSLGKRLGRVNLTARAAAAATTGNSVAPFNFLRRLAQEETESNHELHGRVKRGRQLAARIRSWSTSATTASSSGRIIQTDHANSQDVLNGEPCDAENPLCETFLVIPGEEQRQEKSNVLRPSTANFYDAYCEAFPPCRLRRLDMSWCGNYSAISPVAFGDFLGDACRQLTTLRLTSCKFLNDDCLLYIVNTCPLLRELDLSSCTGITSHGFLALSRLIQLNWLSLYRTQIADDGLLSLAELCQHLCHINLGSCTNVQDMNQVLDNLTRNNTGLISVNLWRCVTVSAMGVSYLARSCPLLEELDLGWCRNIALTQESNCIVHLVQHCGRIRKLHLTGTSLLNSEELTFVSQRLCSTLEQLDIHGSANVNSTAVAMVLSCCTRLRLLDISFCAELPLHSVTRLRRLFPLCTIITSIPDMYVDVLGARPVSADEHVFMEEMVDDIERHLLDQFLDAPFVPHALLGRPDMLALPAPIPLPALTGPTSD
ncbi:F-box/LRR-repeat protein 4 [Clonorchis sinensis]|uniref:F-box/LRR-repeat protein 4 n=1 Tax=Clonorchis sinensis TaxID=79923 RepID=G7YNA6_CLOSI|nr:F-box/LRR-repeat protein 4 [Clonorchis sinensis]